MRHLLFVIAVVAANCLLHDSATAAEHPNIVYILADDLGYGDVHAFNPDGKIKTPHMDRLAAAGMRFTDAHSGSAVCTPTRYGVLTGRYSWRTRLQSGVCWGYSVPLIEKGRMTVASMLKTKGYNTACLGKWHLGLKWALHDPNKVPSDAAKEPWDNIDFSKPISSGPNQVGFDYFYGISASLDMHPHVYIEDDRVTSVPTKIIPASAGKKFWRKGPVADGFKHIEVLDHLTDKAVSFISKQSKNNPFFLYFPLPAPHKPIIPSEKYQDKSGLNEWGDFVMQVDSTVGSVMKAITDKGFAKNTLFIVTSDNGATPGADFGTLIDKGHNPSAKLRGHKADIFEGGHRVAFIARWPEAIAAGTTCRKTICHTDLLATAAEIVGAKLPQSAGEDSVSLLPLMKQVDGNVGREATVHHSVNGSFAIRRDNWKLILCPGSGGWSNPRPPQARKQNLPEQQLFDLNNDLRETQNVSAKHPETASKLLKLLQKYVDQGRSTPGKPQKNATKIDLFK